MKHLTEEQIERSRWWAQRINRSTYSFVQDWQRKNALGWLGHTKRSQRNAEGLFPVSDKIFGLFSANVRDFKSGREDDIPDDMQVFEE